MPHDLTDEGTKMLWSKIDIECDGKSKDRRRRGPVAGTLLRIWLLAVNERSRSVGRTRDGDERIEDSVIVSRINNQQQSGGWARDMEVLSSTWYRCTGYSSLHRRR